MKSPKILLHVCVGTAILLSLSGKAALGISSTAVSQIAEEITIRIEGQNPGSGVIIEQNAQTYTVLTVAHVVATEDEYDIVTPDEKRYPLSYRRVTKLPDVDLALVQFESTSPYKIAKMGNSQNIKVALQSTFQASLWRIRRLQNPFSRFLPGPLQPMRKPALCLMAMPLSIPTERCQE